MIPGVAGTQTLPRLIGVGRAIDAVLSGRWFDAREAQELGIVARVWPRGGFQRRALREAAALAALDPDIVQRLKRCVREGLDLPLAAGIALERRLAD
jgi:enoyl-CoA hydratase/carnithine racemase